MSDTARSNINLIIRYSILMALSVVVEAAHKAYTIYFQAKDMPGTDYLIDASKHFHGQSPGFRGKLLQGKICNATSLFATNSTWSTPTEEVFVIGRANVPNDFITMRRSGEANPTFEACVRKAFEHSMKLTKHASDRNTHILMGILIPIGIVVACCMYICAHGAGAGGCGPVCEGSSGASPELGSLLGDGAPGIAFKPGIP